VEVVSIEVGSSVVVVVVDKTDGSDVVVEVGSSVVVVVVDETGGLDVDV
jgi:hypothetical protein